MPRSKRSARTKYKLDTMSITVLLVMAIFGGLIGYYIGQSTGANQMLQSIEAQQLLQAK